MSKYIVETYYTCSFKIVHKLSELNEKKLSELENRKDGEVEIIDVKLNNRKTKTIGNNTKNDNQPEKQTSKDKNIASVISGEIANISDGLNNSEVKNMDTKVKLDNKGFNPRSKMPDRR